MVIERSSNFFDLIISFAAMGYWNFVGKCPHHGKMHITLLIGYRDMDFSFPAAKSPQMELLLQRSGKSKTFVPCNICSSGANVPWNL